jgi:hypothetical protein
MRGWWRPDVWFYYRGRGGSLRESGRGRGDSDSRAIVVVIATTEIFLIEMS